jgi:signal transduction histidine kinase
LIEPPTPKSAATELAVGISDDSWLVRREAVQRVASALESSTDLSLHSSMAEHLAKLAEDGKWEVRSAVARSLQHLRSPLVDKTLARLLDDPHYDVRRSAEQTLRKKRQATPPGEWGEESSLSIKEHEAHLRRTLPAPVAARALKISQKRLELFARVSAHELKRILTPLKSRINKARKSLGKGGKRDEAVAHLAKAQERCEHIERILEYMKDWTAEVEPQIHKEKLRSMIEEALSLVREYFEATAPALKVKGFVDVDRKLIIDAPRARLIQAFRNIIQNSYEAIATAGSRGTVRITAVAEGDKVRISFEDDGCGMSDETRRDALQPFTSTKNSTGFGLPIADKIIRNECRGELDIQPQDKKWTRLLVTLPRELVPVAEAD